MITHHFLVFFLSKQDARIRGGEREERPADPRARQEEQPMGGEGQMRHHVNTSSLHLQIQYNNNNNNRTTHLIPLLIGTHNIRMLSIQRKPNQKSFQSFYTSFTHSH